MRHEVDPLLDEIRSTELEIFRACLVASGMSIIANNRPTIQKRFFMSEHREKTESCDKLILNLLSLLRDVLGEVVQTQHKDAEHEDGQHQKRCHQDQQDVRSIGAHDEHRRMDVSGWRFEVVWESVALGVPVDYKPFMSPP